jgi:cell division transport system ATP-binding protein
MALLHSICTDYGTALIMATHDYNIIQRFPARIIRTEGGVVLDNASVLG